MNLNGKVCIITGSASGIGKAIAERYVADGARVAIADLRLDAAKATAEELTSNGKGEAIGVEMNVTDEAQVNAAVQQVVDHWGGVDVLVSNAGIQIVHKLENFPYDDWKKLLSIHLDGAFLTSKAVLPHMYKATSQQKQRVASNRYGQVPMAVFPHDQFNSCHSTLMLSRAADHRRPRPRPRRPPPRAG